MYDTGKCSQLVLFAVNAVCRTKAMRIPVMLSYGLAKCTVTLVRYSRLSLYRVVPAVGSTVAQWLALMPHSEKVLGSIPGLRVFLCGVCMFYLCLCGFSPGTPASSHPQRHALGDRLIGDSKLTLCH